MAKFQISNFVSLRGLKSKKVNFSSRGLLFDNLGRRAKIIDCHSPGKTTTVLKMSDLVKLAINKQISFSSQMKNEYVIVVGAREEKAGIVACTIGMQLVISVF